MRFEVVYTQWAADGKVFGGGVHEIARPSAGFLRLLAGAEAAGSVVVLEATRDERAKLGRHVQSQADGEKAYAKAVEEGRWHEGNQAQYEVDPAGFGGEA